MGAWWVSDFLKADVANEVFVSDFAACGYLVFTNGEKRAGVCYPMPWRRRPNLLALTL